MKNIIISLAIIAAVGAVVVGATTAYFSDTEVSTGNTFTAGTLNLVVDIDGQIQEPLAGPIFSERDMKPGDTGEKTLSFHVDNDACLFAYYDLTSDSENTCVEPELAAEPNCNPLGPGELNENIKWYIWKDEGGLAGWQCSDGEGNPEPACEADPQEGDNKFNGREQLVIGGGNLSNDKEYAFGELLASQVNYYGYLWKFKETAGNEVQSDSFTADMIIKAEQKRNQYPEGCPTGVFPRPQEPGEID